MDSILNTIKKMLGVDPSYTAFDTDIIVNINSALLSLNQLGIGPVVCFSIAGTSEIWSDFLGSSVSLEGVKTLIYLKVKLIFDPPTSSFVVEAMNRNISELEWRLSTQVELESV